MGTAPHGILPSGLTWGLARGPGRRAASPTIADRRNVFAGPLPFLRQVLRDGLQLFLELLDGSTHDQQMTYQAEETGEDGQGRHDADDEPHDQPGRHIAMLHERVRHDGGSRSGVNRRQTPSLLAKKSWM